MVEAQRPQDPPALAPRLNCNAPGAPSARAAFPPSRSGQCSGTREERFHRHKKRERWRRGLSTQAHRLAGTSRAEEAWACSVRNDVREGAVMSDLKVRPPKGEGTMYRDPTVRKKSGRPKKAAPTGEDGGLRPLGNESGSETNCGRGPCRGPCRGRDRGHDHPSRGPCANDERLRPTTCARASSSTHEPRAIGGARFPPVHFASRGVRQLGAGDGRLLRCAA